MAAGESHPKNDPLCPVGASIQLESIPGSIALSF